MRFLSIKFSFTLVLLAFIQASFGQTVQRIYGTNCVGSTNEFVIQNAGSGCSYSMEDLGGGQLISQDGAKFRVKWNVPTTNARVGIGYNCSSGSGVAWSSYFNVTNELTPSVSITISPNNNQCEGTEATITATGTNGGTTPVYSLLVNNILIGSSQSSNTFKRTDLKNGDIVKVSMTIGGAGCFSSTSATSTGITMAIAEPVPLDVNISAPDLICSGSTTGNSFRALVTNGGPNLTYSWFRNDPVTDNAFGTPPDTYAPTSPLSNGDKIKCIVTSDGCVTPKTKESAEYVVSLTTSVTPIVSVNTGGTIQFCNNAPVNLSATCSNAVIGAGATYEWKKNGGTTFSTQATTSLIASTATDAQVGYLRSVDAVTVRVTGITGTCLTSTTVTGTLAANTVSIYNYPSAVITVEGTRTVIKSNGDLDLSVPVSSSYKWYRNNVAIPAPAGTANPYLASLAGTYKVDVTGPGTCKTTSANVVLTKNSPPTVTPQGAPVSVVLPATSVSLTGTAADNESTIQSWAWSQISGPPASLTNATTSTMTASGLVAGTYVFRLTVGDSFPEYGSGDFTVQVNYPPNNYNYIRTTTLNKAITDPAAIETMGIDEDLKAEVFEYFDGLGRPSQKVVTQGAGQLLGTTTRKDIVQPVLYDEYGRETTKYLLFASLETTGYFKENAPSDVLAFYTGAESRKISSDARPFSQTTFEPSPLNRPVAEQGAGEAWSGASPKQVLIQYLINVYDPAGSTEKIIAWRVSSTGELIRADVVPDYVEAGGYYDSGQLFIKSTKDENGYEVREYTNKSGQVVLKKVQAVAIASPTNDDHWAQTYYVYDDFGDLAFVLPPEAVKALIAE